MLLGSLSLISIKTRKLQVSWCPSCAKKGLPGNLAVNEILAEHVQTDVFFQAYNFLKFD